uniref:OTU domain-containing protein n=1 Tax=Ditylenchus dipsaci TaxID=166011 RepID=A0A915CM11_9BILA
MRLWTFTRKHGQSQTFKFNPVDLNWRKDCCTKLGLELVSDLDENPYEIFDEHAAQTEQMCGMEEAPEVVGDVIGDGNCLFRALSHIFTAGCQDQHHKLRKKICSFMQLHQKTFARIRGESITSFIQYIHTMQQTFEWGTDVELLACATMLQTPIATFLDGKWVPFLFPCFRLDEQCTRLVATKKTPKHYRKIPEALSPFNQSTSKPYLDDSDEHSDDMEVDENETIVNDSWIATKCQRSNSLQRDHHTKERPKTLGEILDSVQRKAEKIKEKAEAGG